MATSGRRRWIVRQPKQDKPPDPQKETASKPSNDKKSRTNTSQSARSHRPKQTSRYRKKGEANEPQVQNEKNKSQKKREKSSRQGKSRNDNSSDGARKGQKKNPEGTSVKNPDDKERRRDERRRKRAERERRRVEEEKKRKEDEARQKEEEEKKRLGEEARKKREEEERKMREEEERKKKEEEDRIRAIEREEAAKAELSKLRDKLALEGKTRDANLKVIGGRDALPMSLNTKMAKTTGFIKKLRSLPDFTSSQLIAEFMKLNLTKYVQEMASAVADVKIARGSDVNKCIEMCSQIHRRYDGFAKGLYSLLLRVFEISWKPGDRRIHKYEEEELEEILDEDATDLNAKDLAMKKRGSLRLIAELYKLGIFNEAMPIVHIITTLPILQQDGEKKNKTNEKNQQQQNSATNLNIALLNSFLKCAGIAFTGLQPFSIQKAIKDARLEESQKKEFLPSFPDIVSKSDQKKCQKAVLRAHDSVIGKLLFYHKNISRKRKRMKRMELMQGEASAKIQEEMKELQEAFDALLKPAATLSDLVGRPMVEIEEEDEDEEEEELMEVLKLDGAFEVNWESQLFEDPETRSFYENIENLMVIIPKKLLEGGGKKKDESKEKINDKGNDVNEGGEGKAAGESSKEQGDENEKNGGEEEEEEDIDPATLMESLPDELKDLTQITQDEDSEMPTGAETSPSLEGGEEGLVKNRPFDMLLASISNARTTKAIDDATVRFCEYNNKGARNKLVRTLLGVNWRHTELLPYHARMIATLNEVFPDIGQQVTAALFNQLYGLLKGKGQFNLGIKMRNIIYIAELVKFRVTKPRVAFSLLDLCLKNFANHSIVVACTLLEKCGRWLYVNQKSRIRCKKMLDRMMLLRSKRFLDQEKRDLIENAYNASMPSQRAAMIPEKERPTLQKYILFLVRQELANCHSESEARVLLKRLRKLPWDEQCRVWVVKAICNVGRVKFDKLAYLAFLVAGLSKYYDIGVTVVDAVLEELRYGLEHRDFTLHQTMLSICRFIGELYSYHMLELQPILDTFYAIITVGHYRDENGHLVSKVDPPNDTYRVRLVCMLLDTCGIYFEDRHERRRLNRFLVYFQRYILLKRSLPVDVEFLVQDMFDRVCPKTKRLSSLEEAERKIKQLEASSSRAAARDKLTKLDEITEDIEEDDEEGGGDQAKANAEEDRIPEEKGEGGEGKEVAAGQQTEGDSSSKNGEEDSSSNKGEYYRRERPKEDQDFLAEMDKMMLGDIEARRNEARPTEMPDPTALLLRLKQKNSNTTNTSTRGGSSVAALLQRKNNPFARKGGSPSSSSSSSSSSSRQHMVFKLLTKSGGSKSASTARDLFVPVASQMAKKNLLNQEKMREEKAAVKRGVIAGLRREEEEERRQRALKESMGEWGQHARHGIASQNESEDYTQKYIDDPSSQQQQQHQQRYRGGGRRGRRGRGRRGGRRLRGRGRGRNSGGRRGGSNGTNGR